VHPAFYCIGDFFRDVGKGEIFSIGAAAAWAVGVIFYKRLGDQLSPTQLNLLKNLVVFALILPTTFLVEGITPPAMGLQAYGLALLSGFVGIAIADSLYFHGLNLAGAARMGITGNLYSPMVIVLSFIFLGERLSEIQLLGFALVMMGVFMVSELNFRGPAPDADQKQIRRGVLIGAASIFLMAVSIILIKRVLEGQPLFWVSSIRMTGAILGLYLIAKIRGLDALPKLSSIQKNTWITLLVAAIVGQYISMLAWLAGYKYTSASIASVLNETASIFIVLLAWLVLKEQLNRRKLIGIVCTISGVACMLL
jgi:drug/metabolite transporter (DMT)-like permease